jgi:hypothetical protein
MARRKRHWLLNLIIVLTVVVCLLAFTAHYRNWTRLKDDRMQLLTGLYFLDLPYTQLDTVLWKEQIPAMERSHGFSFFAREKGVFTDSLSPGRPVYVFVDDLRQYKMEIHYRDTLVLYLNFADSLETHSMYEYLLERIRSEGAIINPKP